MRIDTDFPGGNGLVLDCAADRIRFLPDDRDGNQEWFYWAFRVHGAAGRRIALEAARPHCFTAAGVACSRDHGRTWDWAAGQERDGDTVWLTVPTDSCLLSMGMSYTLRHWHCFAAAWERHPRWQVEELTRTPAGRSVPLLRIGTGDSPKKVLLTARNHCCEMTPNHVLEGLIPWALERTGGDLAWYIIPFMDLDGVERGDQGKARAPHDHNRYFAGESRYPETAALRKQAPAWGPFACALDLHSPWIEGPWNESIYLVGRRDVTIAAGQRRFWQRVVEQSAGAGLPIQADDFLPFGQAWNTGTPSGYRTCSGWAVEDLGVPLVGTIEVSYGLVHGQPVSSDALQRFGRDLGRAIAADI